MAKINGETVESLVIKNSSGTTLGTLTVTDDSSGSSVASGTITPTAQAASVTIQTGLAEVHGFALMTTATPTNSKYAYKNCVAMLVLDPTSWISYLCSNNGGTSYSAGSWGTASSYIGISGGDITYTYSSSLGYLAPEEFKWVAW